MILLRKPLRKYSREIKRWTHKRGNERSRQFGKPDMTLVRVPETENTEMKGRRKLSWRKKNTIKTK